MESLSPLCYYSGFKMVMAGNAHVFAGRCKRKILYGNLKNSKIKACDRAKSGVYTEVNEHFGSVSPQQS